MRTAHFAFVLAGVFTLASACESDTEATVAYGAALTGASVKPTPVTPAGSGTFSATVTGGAMLTYTLDFQNLTSAAVAANIRGPVSDTGSADVIIDLNGVPSTLGSGSVTLGGTSGSGSGTFNLTGMVASGFGADSLRKLMDAGLLYVSVETANNPAGEIRGQIGRQ
jgi:hypothetical protein